MFLSFTNLNAEYPELINFLLLCIPPEQPGAEDADLISWVKSQPDSVQDRVIYGGPCILVSGRQLAADKGKL